MFVSRFEVSRDGGRVRLLSRKEDPVGLGLSGSEVVVTVWASVDVQDCDAVTDGHSDDESF